MKYNREYLLSKLSEGETIKYLFFWGHQPSKDGSVSKTCFSQWWIAPFEVSGIIYPSAEHWMMAEKARLFNDSEVLEKILSAVTPAEAKKLGRQVKDFDEQTWNEKRFEIVLQGTLHKFKQHKELEKFLITSGDRVIVEASPRDAIWGIGMAESNPKANNPAEWRGLNLLGFALMEARDILKETKTL